MQGPEHVSSAKVEMYASIVSDLKKLGITYRGNEKLLSNAASKVIMQSKMPMERAGVRKRGESKKKQVNNHCRIYFDISLVILEST